MGYKSNIDLADRVVYFSANGNDDFNGRSLELPKRTIQAAIDETTTMARSAGNRAIVVAAQSNIFTDPFTMDDFISVDLSGGTLAVDSPIAIECSSLSGITGNITLNEQNNGSVFLIDTRDSFVIDMSYSCIIGDNATIFDIRGACESIFIRVVNSQIIGDGSVCYSFTGAASSVLFFEGSQIDLLDDNTVGILWDSPSSGAGAIEAITNNGVDAQSGDFLTSFTSTAFLIKKGTYNANIAKCVANTIIKVESGATLNIEMTNGLGDIVVDGTLNCDIISHTGTITNNGIINGNINGVPFGTYRQKHEEQVVLTASSFIDQNPAGTNNPLQITFGAAQFGPTDPVQLSAAGAITVNQIDQYNISLVMEYGRVGAAGAFSLVFFRILIDGIQFGPSRYGELDNPNGSFPIQFSIPLDFAIIGQVLTVEMWRDSTGFDAGSLLTKTPVLIGAGAAPSASIILTRNRLVQPI